MYTMFGRPDPAAALNAAGMAASVLQNSLRCSLDISASPSKKGVRFQCQVYKQSVLIEQATEGSGWSPRKSRMSSRYRCKCSSCVESSLRRRSNQTSVLLFLSGDLLAVPPDQSVTKSSPGFRIAASGPWPDRDRSLALEVGPRIRSS